VVKPTTTKSGARTHVAAERHPPATPPSAKPAATPSDLSALIPGGSATFRRPGGDTVTVTTPTRPPVITPTRPPAQNPKATGVSGADGPEDPYGAGDTIAPDPADSSGDAAPGEQKAPFYANLGQQQLAGGDVGSAAASFKKALELDGKNVAATLGMGEIAMKQGLFGDAIAHFKKATRLASSARAFTLLGEAYLNSGNNGEAATAFKKALQLEPDNTRARDGYNEASNKVPSPDE
jgi:hypothetical protein